MPQAAGEHNSSDKSSRLPRVWWLTIAAFLAGLLVSGTTLWQYELNEMQSRRQAVTDVTLHVADDIETNLSRSLSSTYALAAVIRQNNGNIPNFPQLAREMLDLYPGISSIQIAPNGIITQIVPPEGNEKAVGHNLLADSKRNREAFRALETRSLTLAGPFELLQGGEATIGRLPIFLRGQSGKEKFWGFSIALIRIEDLLRVANIRRVVDRGIKYELSRIHPDTGQRDVFSSHGGTLSKPVRHVIRVPNGEWTFAAEPEKGWRSSGEVLAEVIFVLCFSSLLALAVWWLARRPLVLQRMVDDRTLQLTEANRKLQNEVGERSNAEQALAASEAKLRSIFASLTDVILILDADGRYIEVAPTSTNRLILPPEQMIGKTMRDVLPREKAELFVRTIRETLKSGKNSSIDYSLPYGDSEVWFTGTVAPLGPESVVWSARDITQRKHAEDERLKLETQMLHAQKLESLGVLAGGIAHDFNNILTAIIGNADLALMRLTPESPAVENLRRIHTAAARASDLARQMLAYSGKGRFVIEELDLNRLVQEMGHMLEVSISKKAALRYHCEENLPKITADATQIRQIIMNLVINASEAIGDQSGVISVSTSSLECSDAYLKETWLCDGLSSGLYVALEVADTGCGMSRETLEKIFDPFFTTKFTGRGLGMAAVQGIVRSHKGAIKVYSEPGKGSTFKLLFPVGNQQEALLDNFAGFGGDWQGSGNVLLVDDEEIVRELGSEMLTELGYQVVTAGDGREALELFKTRTDISLVILDLTMPHMDGEQCFRALRQIDPGVKVILSSGFNEQEVSRKFIGKGLSGFIQKPYTLTSLRDVLRLA